jgi:transcriptional regulator with XRE-family HTH domain
MAQNGGPPACRFDVFRKGDTMARDYIRGVLSDNLKKLRKRRSWSQLELARRANISMNFLSDIERSRKWPYPETLQNLAAALGVEVFEFFKPKESETDFPVEEYINRFSNDMVVAVEKSVKNAVFTIARQYNQAPLR